MAAHCLDAISELASNPTSAPKLLAQSGLVSALLAVGMEDKKLGGGLAYTLSGLAAHGGNRVALAGTTGVLAFLVRQLEQGDIQVSTVTQLGHNQRNCDFSSD